MKKVENCWPNLISHASYCPLSAWRLFASHKLWSKPPHSLPCTPTDQQEQWPALLSSLPKTSGVPALAAPVIEQLNFISECPVCCPWERGDKYLMSVKCSEKREVIWVNFCFPAPVTQTFHLQALAEAERTECSSPKSSLASVSANIKIIP